MLSINRISLIFSKINSPLKFNIWVKRLLPLNRVFSLMFQFLDQNRYDTSFKSLIIMSLQDMLT